MLIRCFRLRTGEDILTSIEENANGTITFVNPAQIIMQPTQQGFQIGLAPFLGFAEGRRITVNADAVLFTYEPVKGLADEYIRTTTGLVIANQLPPDPNSADARRPDGRPNLSIIR